jgi:hypothetical protein
MTVNSQGQRMSLSEQDFHQIFGLVKSFFLNKAFFERDYLNDGRVQFDYNEQMLAEDNALQEIGIGIRDQEILI